MKLLVLGGTNFIGPHIVERAVARKHTVTLFNRGKTNPGLFPDLEQLRGDREKGDLDALRGRKWDAVIDTNVNYPRWIREALAILAPNVGQYLFVSSISVYTGEGGGPIDETSPVAKMEDPSVEDLGPNYENFGPLKALCEKTAEEKMPGHVTVLRPGLIVGRGDKSDRFPYWPARVRRGGEVLAPDDPGYPIQYIDVRDLADFTVKTVEDGHAGTFNVVIPPKRLSIGELLVGCKIVTGSDARFTWVAEDFLAEHGVRPWIGLPVWMGRENAAFSAASNDRAVAVGLAFRTPAATIEHVLDCLDERGPVEKPRAGITAEKETEVLAAWRARSTK